MAREDDLSGDSLTAFERDEEAEREEEEEDSGASWLTPLAKIFFRGNGSSWRLLDAVLAVAGAGACLLTLLCARCWWAAARRSVTPTRSSGSSSSRWQHVESIHY